MNRKTKARSASKPLGETRSLLFPFGIGPSALSRTFCLERRREGGSFSLSLSPFVPIRSFVGSFLSPPPSVSRRHASRVARGHLLNYRSAKARLKKKKNKKKMKKSKKRRRRECVPLRSLV